MFRRVLAAAAAGLLAVAGWAAPSHAASPYGTVVGTYTAADGTPIVNSHIVVESNTDRIVGWGNTDAAGHYSIDLFTWAESVRLSFDHGFMKQWAHQKTTEAEATLFPIASGVTVTVDETELPVGTIVGAYTSFTGEPIAGAQVYAYSLDNRVLASGYTGPDGRYRVSPTPFGPVKLRYTDHGVAQWAHQKPDFASAETIQVTGQEPVVVDETQIELGTIEGEVTLPSGAPAEDFHIYAAQVGGTALTVGGILEDDGRYRINVPAGRWRVAVDHDAVGTQYVPQKPKAADATIFTVAAGQVIEVDETLRPLGGITGELKRANGSPVAEQDLHLWKDGVEVREKDSDEAGGYLFSALEPGGYQLSWDNSDGTQTYVPGTLRRDQADTIVVRPGEVTVADTRYAGPATVRGRLTTPDGAPLSKIFVEIKAVAGGYSYAEVTDSNGEWAADGITPEEYRISFRNTDAKLTQTAPGTYHLAANTTTTVDETWTLGNTLRITAPAGFCATVNTWTGYCTDSDTLSIVGVPTGPATVVVHPDNGSNYLPSGRIPVTVADGGITPLTVSSLEEGGRISVTIVDRINGAGQKQWCLVLAVPGEGFPSMESDIGCTHKTGKFTTYAMRPGTFQMFVYSTNSLGLGAQWVGENGGSGNQKDAVKIKVKVGKVTRPPTILLDRGGTVAGTVRDAAGAPMAKVNVSPDAWSLAGPPPSSESFTSGSYRIYLDLGPYDWPLFLTPKDGAAPRQLLGNGGNRFQAPTVKVRPDRVTTYDPVLITGSRLTGTVTTSRSFTTGRVTAVNAATGDDLATATFTSDNRTYDMPVIGPGPVLLRWSLTGPAASGSWPDKVNVPKSGTKTVDLTINES